LLAINDPRRALILANEQGQQQGQAETDVSFGGDIFCGGSGAGSSSGGDIFGRGSGAGSSSGDGAKVDTTAGVVAGAGNQVNGFSNPPLPVVETNAALALATGMKKVDYRARVQPTPPPPARLQQSTLRKSIKIYAT
jgi:hypothetical protein